MRISKEQLQKIVAEEVQAHFKKSLMSESKSESRTIKATPAMLKRIINEEVLKLNEMRDVTDNDLLLDIREDGVFVVYKGKEEKLNIKPSEVNIEQLKNDLRRKYMGLTAEKMFYKYPNSPFPVRMEDYVDTKKVSM